MTVKGMAIIGLFYAVIIAVIAWFCVANGL